MQIAGLNTLDLLLLVILGIGILSGFMRGIASQLMSLISIWLALVATLWLYKPFSTRILQGLGLPEIGSDTLAFLILLVVFFNAIRLIIKALSTPPEERKRKKMSKEDPLAEAAKSAGERFVVGPSNLIGGALLGLILTMLWLALFLGLLQFIFQPTEAPVGDYGTFARRISQNLRTSALVPYFNQVLLLLARSVSWFVPDEANILNRVLGLLG